MHKAIVYVVSLSALALLMCSTAPAQMQIYGAWHCGSDYCTWASVRNMTDFDTKNHWIIDRGDGSGLPSVNLVILSFVQPLKLLNKTNDAGDVNGVPIGMNSAIVNYFTSHNIRVMLSIGGITYTSFWDQALSANPTQLGLNAAALAKSLGVGIEIDYENSSSPNLTGLQAFVNAYRSQIPYDATGANPAARLTIDLGAGDQWLTDITRYATVNWLNNAAPVLDYANAMVPNKQPNTSGAESNWQQHIDGKANYAPPVPPLAPNRFTGSLYIVTGHNPAPECNNFSASLENSTGSYVQTVAPNGAGTTHGLLGFMFWAAECQGTHSICTTPPNTCEAGAGAGAKTYNIPLPMPALRQN
ncbi:MAG: hypothetical protein DMG93_20765 [Acidobacteria bacterium]|nr:MAG: hypothetical protein DMG93_20765 [Acidobacteriota bacterium]